MNRKEIDLNQVVVTQEKALQRALGEAIALKIQPAERAANVHADETAIAQILTGLAENARRSLPGGGAVSILVEHIDVDEIHARIQPGARRGRFVRLTVADNGLGLHTERLMRLLEELPPAGVVSSGTALSLPLIIGIVRRRGGWVEAHSQTSGGTVIHLYFPVALATTKNPPEWQAETILLVDDEVAMRRMVKNVLERASYRVIEADTGVQALAVWEECKERVNLLLTDMVMPDGLTGRGLAQQLIATKPELKVIYTSGFELDDDARRDTSTGQARFLHKPYDMRRLLETVHLAMKGAADPATAPEVAISA